MTTHVLVPIDGSAQANAALVRAAEIFPHGTITLLYVADPDDEGVTGLSASKQYERRHEDVERLFEHARGQVPANGPTIETAVRSGSAWRQIVTYAKEEGVDHVVVGSHGRDGASRLLLGSVAELVVRRAPVPVTVVK